MIGSIAALNMTMLGLLFVLRDKTVNDSKQIVVNFEEVFNPNRVVFAYNVERFFERMQRIIKADHRTCRLHITATVDRCSDNASAVTAAEARNQGTAESQKLIMCHKEFSFLDPFFDNVQATID